MIFATKEQLAAYIEPDVQNPPVPDKAVVRLRAASGLVSDHIAGAIYATDTEGLPTDPVKLAAVRDATLEHAQALVLNNIDPRIGSAGLKPIVTTKALGGASVSYGQSAPVQQAVVALAEGRELVPSALAILQRAGLISNRAGRPGGGVEYFNIQQRYYDPLTGDLDGQ